MLVNLDEGFKAVDIDLLSRQTVKSYSFIITDPDFKADHKQVDFETLYPAEDIINIEDESELRRVLEALPCCTTNKDGDEYGDPLNLILIGGPNDILPAVVRRNWHATEITWSQAIIRTIKSFLQGERYRYSPISPLYVIERRQDIGLQKARGTINERNHMRFWLSPIRFRGRRVGHPDDALANQSMAYGLIYLNISCIQNPFGVMNPRTSSELELRRKNALSVATQTA